MALALHFVAGPELGRAEPAGRTFNFGTIYLDWFILVGRGILDAPAPLHQRGANATLENRAGPATFKTAASFAGGH